MKRWTMKLPNQFTLPASQWHKGERGIQIDLWTMRNLAQEEVRGTLLGAPSREGAPGAGHPRTKRWVATAGNNLFTMFFQKVVLAWGALYYAALLTRNILFKTFNNRIPKECVFFLEQKIPNRDIHDYVHPRPGSL